MASKKGVTVRLILQILSQLTIIDLQTVLLIQDSQRLSRPLPKSNPPAEMKVSTEMREN